MNRNLTLALIAILSVILIVLLGFAAWLTMAAGNTTPEPSVSTTVPAVTTEPTTEATTEPTTAPTTAPTTEPTTAPTTAPTTEPTTAPTTEPEEEIGIRVTVTYEPNVVNPGSTYTGLPVLEPVEYIVTDADNWRDLDSDRRGFSYGIAQNGVPHNVTKNNQTRFDDWGTNALAWDNKTEEKVLYLTFDCGYAFEDLTDRILDTLKDKKVPAAFFCTMDFVRACPRYTTRMIQEGHIVGNHSTTHPDCTELCRADFAEELLGVHNYLRVNYGYNSKYFRFPTGAYTENVVDLADTVGYRCIFWSIAHVDWDPYNQPGEEASFNAVTSRLHPGAVILLHATSPDNAAILDRFIEYAWDQGYEFRSLDQYPAWK